MAKKKLSKIEMAHLLARIDEVSNKKKRQQLVAIEAIEPKLSTALLVDAIKSGEATVINPDSNPSMQFVFWNVNRNDVHWPEFERRVALYTDYCERVDRERARILDEIILGGGSLEALQKFEQFEPSN